MADNRTESDDETTVDVETVRRFAACLSSLGAAYAAIAEWLEKHDVKQIPGGGTLTAKLGLKHIGNFTSTVLTAYQRAVLSGQIPEASPDAVSKAYATLASAKDLAIPHRKKKK